MFWTSAVLTATLSYAYASEFIHHGDTAFFGATPRADGKSIVEKLYGSCSLHDVNGPVIQTKEPCVTSLFRHLIVQLGASPSGYSVAAGRAGFGNVTVSSGRNWSDGHPLQLPTSFQYYEFDGNEVGGLKIQAHEKNGTVTSAFVKDLEDFAAAFTDQSFNGSDSWSYRVCDNTGHLLFYGRIVAEEFDFAEDIEDVQLPSCLDMVKTNHSTIADASSVATFTSSPPTTTLPPYENIDSDYIRSITGSSSRPEAETYSLANEP
ncbi:hypothetical protein M409DRAFT_31020 [Zasmidium cellare ATCC 36951]|uniref:Uncharacterized protein n=1 Tax=Zasmidium cellare ATCC 36951 TaxID=1080233 RepID=A0A6A6BY82_ZASCE|nr:uncharacterized protein M409DRAFT_31020 [Zasmidium cellare ATCC 36951]KAF2158489.1 hypothetical protein M409DRAFT_31020 [Zasmidium cellare ATCC 36951]